MAKIPSSRIKKPEPTLAGLSVGETVFVNRSAMMANLEGDCFLNPDATFSREKSRAHTLRVSRQTDGFHVAILASDTWKLEKGPSFLPDVWIGTATVTEDPDPELDRDLRAEARAGLAEVAASIENAERILLELRSRQRGEGEK